MPSREGPTPTRAVGRGRARRAEGARASEPNTQEKGGRAPARPSESAPRWRREPSERLAERRACICVCLYVPTHARNLRSAHCARTSIWCTHHQPLHLRRGPGRVDASCMHVLCLHNNMHNNIIMYSTTGEILALEKSPYRSLELLFGSNFTIDPQFDNGIRLTWGWQEFPCLDCAI